MLYISMNNTITINNRNYNIVKTLWENRGLIKEALLLQGAKGAGYLLYITSNGEKRLLHSNGKLEISR